MAIVVQHNPDVGGYLQMLLGAAQTRAASDADERERQRQLQLQLATLDAARSAPTGGGGVPLGGGPYGSVLGGALGGSPAVLTPRALAAPGGGGGGLNAYGGADIRLALQANDADNQRQRDVLLANLQADRDNRLAAIEGNREFNAATRQERRDAVLAGYQQQRDYLMNSFQTQRDQAGQAFQFGRDLLGNAFETARDFRREGFAQDADSRRLQSSTYLASLENAWRGERDERMNAWQTERDFRQEGFAQDAFARGAEQQVGMALLQNYFGEQTDQRREGFAIAGDQRRMAMQQALAQLQNEYQTNRDMSHNEFVLRRDTILDSFQANRDERLYAQQIERDAARQGNQWDLAELHGQQGMDQLERRFSLEQERQMEELAQAENYVNQLESQGVGGSAWGRSFITNFRHAIEVRRGGLHPSLLPPLRTNQQGQIGDDKDDDRPPPGMLPGPAPGTFRTHDGTLMQRGPTGLWQILREGRGMDPPETHEQFVRRYNAAVQALTRVGDNGLPQVPGPAQVMQFLQQQDAAFNQIRGGVQEMNGPLQPGQPRPMVPAPGAQPGGAPMAPGGPRITPGGAMMPAPFANEGAGGWGPGAMAGDLPSDLRVDLLQASRAAAAIPDLDAADRHTIEQMQAVLSQPNVGREQLQQVQRMALGLSAEARSHFGVPEDAAAAPGMMAVAGIGAAAPAAALDRNRAGRLANEEANRIVVQPNQQEWNALVPLLTSEGARLQTLARVQLRGAEARESEHVGSALSRVAQILQAAGPAGLNRSQQADIYRLLASVPQMPHAQRLYRFLNSADIAR